MPESRIPPERKREVAERAGHRCEYCWSQLHFSPDSFSVEHIEPRSVGGSDEIGNLALACQGCNSRKYTSIDALDPATGMKTPLYNPRRQPWTEHFTWSEDFTLIIGLTPTGRATAEKLQLNREGVVNLRRILRSIKLHPPSPIRG